MVVWEERVRQDKRGRRIGYNWWREYNCDLLLDASLVWERQCEQVAIGYPTETAEYAEEHPRPTLKAFLLANKGMGQPPD
jgi:hypothetical protein